MLNREFWYVLIFHNCPYLSNEVQDIIDKIIQKLQPFSLKTNPSDKAIYIIYNFLQIKNSQGTKPNESFFNWSGEKDIGSKITYRTYQRTVFKKYNKKSGFYTSID